MLNRISLPSFRKPLALAVLSIGLSGGLINAEDRYVQVPLREDASGPSQSAPEHAAPAGHLTIEQIGQALDATFPGKNTITDNGQTYYTLNIKRGTWTFHLTVSLSPNGNVLWIDAPLIKIDDAASVSPVAMVNLLKKNSDLGPMFFQVAGNQMLELTEPIPNRDLSVERVQGQIEDFLAAIRDTEPQWKKEVVTPAAGEAPAKVAARNPLAQ